MAMQNSSRPAGPVTTELAAALPTFESTELFRGGKEIMIRHDGAVYIMKITRQGKLILNK